MVYRLHKYAYLCGKRFPLLSKIITVFVRVFCGCDLPYTVKVGGYNIRTWRLRMCNTSKNSDRRKMHYFSECDFGELF